MTTTPTSSNASPSRALQRVIVRMHYDPGFADRVYSDTHIPELDSAARELLRRVDRRAFRTDPERGDRSLEALIREAPASSALAGIDRIRQFFSSPHFHQAIRERASLAPEYCRWLEDCAGPIARLEATMAQARRRGPVPADCDWQTAPGTCALRLPQGTLARFGQIRAALAADPVQAIARGQRVPKTTATTRLHKKRREIIVAMGHEVGGGSHGLWVILEAAHTGIGHAQLVGKAVAAGAAEHEAEQILADLREEGMLVRRGAT